MEQLQQKTILTELWSFLRARKKYWVIPLLLLLGTLALLFYAVEGSEVSPFMYTLF